MLNTPVLLLVFNRPDTTSEVFNKIRECAPARLYIAADGPRVQVESDAENCRKVREIVSHVDWKCDVKLLFREENMGCRPAVIDALKWFFNQEEKGIVLEDDCVPDLSFFKYCERLLEKFRNDNNIAIISGMNYSDSPLSTKYDFFTGDFAFSWGWASWARVINAIDWEKKYDLNDIYKRLSFLYDKRFADEMFHIIRHTYTTHANKNNNIWDADMLVHILMHEQKGITPNVNLIANIGFAGTHYAHSKKSGLSALSSSRLAVEEDFENKFTEMPAAIKRKIIKNYLEFSNPLTLRDRLYLFRKKLLQRIKR